MPLLVLAEMPSAEWTGVGITILSIVGGVAYLLGRMTKRADNVRLQATIELRESELKQARLDAKEATSDSRVDFKGLEERLERLERSIDDRLTAMDRTLRSIDKSATRHEDHPRRLQALGDGQAELRHSISSGLAKLRERIRVLEALAGIEHNTPVHGVPIVRSPMGGDKDK